MAQTERSWSALETLLADNTTGSISPQDLRDAFASFMGYGSMWEAVGSATMSAVGTTFSVVDVYNTKSQSSDVNTSGVVVDIVTDNDITVTSAGVYFVSFFASFATSENNKVVTFRPHIDGVAGDIESVVQKGTNTDVESCSAAWIHAFTAGQAIDLRVKVDAGTSDITFETVGLTVHRVG